MNTIDTPNEKVAFLEFVGMVDSELKSLDTLQSIMDMYTIMENDVTDYSKESFV